MKYRSGFYLSVLFLVGVSTGTAFSAEKKSAEKSPPAGPSDSKEGDSMEQVNVDSIKEKYWALGNETELGVVQNRTFSKRRKLEFSLMGGVTISDPFIDIKQTGLSLTYHFSEYFGLGIAGWKYFVNPSSALEDFQNQLGATTNTNYPKYYLGLEGLASIFYGKLSVLGKSIIYYDFHILGGAGMMSTDSGNSPSPMLGFGQRFYVSKIVSLRLDYRLQYFHETILEKQSITRLGQTAGYRDNWSHSIMLGVSFMPFGG